MCILQQVQAAAEPSGGNGPTDHQVEGRENFQFGKEARRQRQTDRCSAGKAVHGGGALPNPAGFLIKSRTLHRCLFSGSGVLPGSAAGGGTENAAAHRRGAGLHGRAAADQRSPHQRGKEGEKRCWGFISENIYLELFLHANNICQTCALS